ncbi:beta-phosphoglucomutase [Carnobacterium inhibens]|uniref:Beta-phosphoglucomutase n=1 Tax=Carnobacterium inhibens subsp. gilichinskyi TaxID=1266845 RepID=U5SGJ2_9LACT|nr:beta-phosphoglucomutase [Carnobacterium inhibens]AGY83007.1 beta-phosphoglucomutase [Carnobacterium inhibens subsp. gilichinskyi]
MIKGIIFDLDGVITDTAQLHYNAWKKLAEELEIFFDYKFNETLKGVSRMDSLDKILIYGKKQNDYSTAEKEVLAEKKNNHYIQELNKLNSESILPGIKGVLMYLKEQNLLIALASASKNAPIILKKLELYEKFDVIIDPATLKEGKPNPEIYLNAVEVLGLQNSEVIGIEDAVVGVKAVNSANILSVGVGDKMVLKEANVVISTTKELLNCIKRIQREQL